MQSLASLMSMKQADIGNLDDFEEDNEEDEENRVNQEEKAAKITGWFCHNGGKLEFSVLIASCVPWILSLRCICTFFWLQNKTRCEMIWLNMNP